MNPPIVYFGPKPRLKTPPKACECHSHFYGPEAVYPYAGGEGRRHHPDATIAEYRAVCAHLGIERSVIVHPSAYGIDNRRSVDAIRELGLDRARGIAACGPDITKPELAALNAAGMRGVRITRSGLANDLGIDDLPALAPRLADIGWHVQVQEDGAKALEWLPPLRGLPVPVVIDHIARLPKNMELNDPRFVALQRLLETGNVWLKISGPYHGSAQGHPYSDVVPRIHALAEVRPDRLVWALNWPHPPFAPDNKPDAAACLDVLLDAVPDTATRNAILADNPARLYGFPD